MCAVLGIIWLGDIFFNAPVEDFDEDLSKEEQELLSETKRRRLKDGTLQIFKSDFVVEGLLRKLVTVKPGDGAARSDEEGSGD